MIPSSSVNQDANDGFLDLPVVQVHADFVADLVLALLIGLFAGWQVGNLGQSVAPGQNSVVANAPFPKG